MTATAENTFRTKAGVCTITPEQLVLSRTGVRGAASNVVVGRSLARVLVFYAFFAVVNLLVSVYLLAQGTLALLQDNGLGLVYCMCGGLTLVVGIYLLRAVLTSGDLSATPVIERAAIRRIEAHAPIPPLTRGYLILHFDDHGQPRRRAILLPGCFVGGTTEYRRAVSLLREEGLLERELDSDRNG